MLSIPFWILGIFVDLSEIIPINLPISALALVCPIMAAIILTKGENRDGGVNALLQSVLIYRKPPAPAWVALSFLLIPALMLVTYWLMKLSDFQLPAMNVRVTDVIIFAILFFIAAICEEVGWTGFITDPLQERYGALKAALIIGTMWAIWHIVPYIQAHRSAAWIFWHCLGTVALRIIIVWLYNNTGRWLLTAIICHTTVNLSEFLFPNYGSHYNPFVFAVVLIFTAIAIVVLWGPKTLAQFRLN